MPRQAGSCLLMSNGNGGYRAAQRLLAKFRIGSGATDERGRAQTFASRPSAKTAEWPVTEVQRAYAALADERRVIDPADIRGPDGE